MNATERKVERSLDYWIFSISSGELEKSAAAHVLARAYREAWRIKNLKDPEGAHHFGPLDMVICYGGYVPPRVAIDNEGVKPRAQFRRSGHGHTDEDE
jgi:hypothetical protein